MQLVLWFAKLQPGITPGQYEDFVRAVDYPACLRVPSIVWYQSMRLEGPAMGDGSLPYDFLDMAEITEVEAYRHDLESHPAVEEVHGQSGRYVLSIGNLWGTPIEGKPGRGRRSAGGSSARKPAVSAGSVGPRVVWYSRLQPGVDRDVYEQWVRAVDYAGAEEIDSLTSYTVFRVQGPCIGETVPFDYNYFEVAEVTGMQEYLHDLEHHPAALRIVAEIGQYVESVGSAWGYPVPPQAQKRPAPPRRAKEKRR
jgi:hypothetical protein